MLQPAEQLAKPGQQEYLIITTILRLESTTTAGIQRGVGGEFGATPLIMKRNGSTARFHSASQRMIVKKVCHLGSHIREV